MSNNPLNVYEVQILENYKFLDTVNYRDNRNKNDHLLCVETTTDGKVLSFIERKKVTFWELFKKWFGCGILKNLSLRINDIGNYLETRDIEDIRANVAAMETIKEIAGKIQNYGDKKLSNRLWEKIDATSQWETTPRSFQLAPVAGIDRSHIG